MDTVKEVKQDLDIWTGRYRALASQDPLPDTYDRLHDAYTTKIGHLEKRLRGLLKREGNKLCQSSGPMANRVFEKQELQAARAERTRLSKDLNHLLTQNKPPSNQHLHFFNSTITRLEQRIEQLVKSADARAPLTRSLVAATVATIKQNAMAVLPERAAAMAIKKSGQHVPEELILELRQHLASKFDRELGISAAQAYEKSNQLLEMKAELDMWTGQLVKAAQNCPSGVDYADLSGVYKELMNGLEQSIFAIEEIPDPEDDPPVLRDESDATLANEIAATNVIWIKMVKHAEAHLAHTLEVAATNARWQASMARRAERTAKLRARLAYAARLLCCGLCRLVDEKGDPQLERLLEDGEDSSASTPKFNQPVRAENGA